MLARREPQLANDPVGAQDRLDAALAGVDHDLVVLDCPPSLGLLTVNALFAADAALVVTEPSAWAVDGVAQILRTVARIANRRGGALTVAGIVVNRLGRTRDARYWHGQLVETYGDQVIATVALRAALAEASAQSLPIHGLGARPGAAEAAAELDVALGALLPDVTVDLREPSGAREDDVRAAPVAGDRVPARPPAPVAGSVLAARLVVNVARPEDRAPDGGPQPEDRESS
jgi:chromosome partitioning protein